MDLYTDIIRPSVYTNRIANENGLLIYTDKIRDKIISIGKNYRRKNSINNSVGFRRYFGCDSL